MQKYAQALEFLVTRGAIVKVFKKSDKKFVAVAIINSNEKLTAVAVDYRTAIRKVYEQGIEKWGQGQRPYRR